MKFIIIELYQSDIIIPNRVLYYIFQKDYEQLSVTGIYNVNKYVTLFYGDGGDTISE